MIANLSCTITVFVAGVVVGAILTVLDVPVLRTVIRHGILIMMHEEPAFSAGIAAGELVVRAFRGW